jgi:pimeloyl-ACP methyl ester carboxylesterase
MSEMSEETTMGIISLAGVDIDVWEGGDGPPLLFLHGAGGFRTGPAYLDRLGRHRRIIAPSHPGWGLSGLADWMDRPEDIAHLYLELLDRLRIEHLDIVGTSFGGWVAAELATMQPRRLRRLVLVAPAGVKTGDRDALDIPDMFATPAATLERMLYVEPEKFRPDPAKMSDEDLRVMLRNRESFALFAWDPYLHNPKLPHRLHRVTCPTLFLRGEKDGLISAAYMERYAALLPDARAITLPNAAHVPQMEQPDAFCDAVLNFLREGA